MSKDELTEEGRKNTESFNEDSVLEQINESLKKQVNEELGFEWEENEEEEKKKKKFPKWFKITSAVIACLLVVVFAAGITVYGYLDKMHTDWSEEKQLGESFEKDNDDRQFETMDPNAIKLQDAGGKRHDENVINILLVGEESIGAGDTRGRTDSIMIASVNIKQKALKLSSLMRDTYVKIPGFSDNKLNAAYHNGGIPLLYSTIEENFGIELDGSVLVNFDGFEKIIDKLGGVEITLTNAEAAYLNRTNYISNPANRHVRVGKQTLNGNQALGYSRIRYVKTGENVRDDFGRTSRQRTVLNAIFEKYKSKSLPELISLMKDLVPLVRTDIEVNDMIAYISTVVTLGATELETFRYPVDNAYTGGKVRGMSVLIPDLAVNNNALHDFIFGAADTAAAQSGTGNSGQGANTPSVSSSVAANVH